MGTLMSTLAVVGEIMAGARLGFRWGQLCYDQFSIFALLIYYTGENNLHYTSWIIEKPRQNTVGKKKF